MAVDVNIGVIETKLSAADAELLRSPEFLAALAALVKEELKRDALDDARRAQDMGQIGGQDSPLTMAREAGI